MFVADFSHPDSPVVENCVFVDELQEIQLYKHTVFMFGAKQFVSLDLKTKLQQNVTPPNTVLSSGAKPTTSYVDKQRQLIFVGFDCGVTEVYQIGQTRLTKLQGISGITTAGVNIVTSYQIFGNQYYFIGTNDSLYCYEQSFALRGMVKLQDQGVSNLLLIQQPGGDNSMGIVQKALDAADDSISQTGEHIDINTPSAQRRILSPMRLVVGCTDGQVVVFDALSLNKICSFDAVQGDDDEDENMTDSDYVKPVMAMGILDDALIVTGDRFIYLYSTAFEQMGQEEDKLEDEASLDNPDEQSIE